MRKPRESEPCRNRAQAARPDREDRRRVRRETVADDQDLVGSTLVRVRNKLTSNPIEPWIEHGIASLNIIPREDPVIEQEGKIEPLRRLLHQKRKCGKACTDPGERGAGGSRDETLREPGKGDEQAEDNNRIEEESA